MKMPKPGAAEARRARLWREHHGLSKKQLGELIGYSPEAIYWFEEGKTPPGRRQTADTREIKPWVWLRYLMACAGIQRSLETNRDFKWDSNLEGSNK